MKHLSLLCGLLAATLYAMEDVQSDHSLQQSITPVRRTIAQHRHFIFEFMRMQKKFQLPNDVMPLIASYLIAEDNKEDAPQRLALTGHLLLRRNSLGLLLQAFKKSNCYELCNDPICVAINEEYNHYGSSSLTTIERIIKRIMGCAVVYNPTDDEKISIEKFDHLWEELNKSCLENNQDLWHYALHCVFHRRTLLVIKKKLIETMVKQQKVTINHQNSVGQTILMGVVNTMYNETEFISWLLEKGADKKLQDVHGNTALTLACWERNVAIVDLLYDREIADLKNNFGISPLMAAQAAIDDGRIAKVTYLRERGHAI